MWTLFGHFRLDSMQPREWLVWIWVSTLKLYAHWLVVVLADFLTYLHHSCFGINRARFNNGYVFPVSWLSQGLDFLVINDWPFFIKRLSLSAAFIILLLLDDFLVIVLLFSVYRIISASVFGVCLSLTDKMINVLLQDIS